MKELILPTVLVHRLAKAQGITGKCNGILHGQGMEFGRVFPVSREDSTYQANMDSAVTQRLKRHTSGARKFGSY